MRTLIAGLASALFFSAAAPAAAADREHRVVVRTADLDLTGPRGVRALDRRLSDALTQACGKASSIDLAGQNKRRQCLEAARSSVTAQKARLVLAAGKAAAPIVAARD